MSRHFVDALRTLRTAGGLSLAELAARANYSKPQTGLIAAGTRPPTLEFAIAADRALGTTPLLVTILGVDEGEDEDMRRRALLTTFVAAAGISASISNSALSEVVRRGLHDAIGEPADWDAIIADLDRRVATDSDPMLGDALMAQLMVARHRIAERPTDQGAIRAHALIGLTYGLWLSNTGDLQGARGWYETAKLLADRSGDQKARGYVRARIASRGPYDGLSFAQTRANIDSALEIAPSAAAVAMEAHAAAVHLSALTGDVGTGRQHAREMVRIAETLPQGPRPVERANLYRTFLECRTGNSDEAERVLDAAAPGLKRVPAWALEAQMYYGRALVQAGDIRGGITHALQTLKGRSETPRWVAIGVADLTSAIPAGYESDDLIALQRHAATGGPWEGVAS